MRVEYLLPFACAAAALCVGASELMTTFEFDLGTSGETQQTIAAADRHSSALLVLAIFALVALAVAVVAGSRPAAIAVAVAGGLSLLFFLVVDLPDVGQQGTVDEPSRVFFSSEAEPGDGFWLELVGSVALAVSGAALATLRPEQLKMFPWSRSPETRRRRRSGDHSNVEPATRAARAATPGVVSRPVLPAVVREGLVGLSHAVDVVLALPRATLLAGRVEDLVREPLLDRLLAPLARELDQPPHGERARPARGHLDGHLVGRAADAPRPHLEHGVSSLTASSRTSTGGLLVRSPTIARAS